MEEMVVGSMPRLARKRRRLNAVLDKIASHIKPVTPVKTLNGDDLEVKAEAEEALLRPDKMYGDQESDLDGRKHNTAALRREQWRETQQQSIGSIDDGRLDGRGVVGRPDGRPPDPVFKFDSLDRERLGIQGAISEEAEEEDVFSPLSSRSPHSSLSSPQVSVDSPRICFSPLRIKDSIEEEEDNRGIVRANSLTVPDNVIFPLPTLSVRGCDNVNSNEGRRSPGKRGLPPGPHLVRWPSPGPEPNKHSLHPTSGLSPHTRSASPLSPATPSTPISPSPGIYLQQFEQYFKSKYVGDMYSRRCMSETDLSATWEHLRQDRGVPVGDIEDTDTINLEPKFDPSSFTLKTHPKASSLESDQSSISLQESPLDLSVRSSVSSTTGLSHEQLAALQSTSETIASRFLLSGTKRNPMSSFNLRPLSTDSIPNTLVSKESIATKYNLEVSPVVEAMPTGSELTYVCPICGQMFSLHDRLAKHMASRHKSRSTDSSSKQYLCDICKRSFARSDMLTRHMRLHTGIKPYTCRMCGQVFSRSDHLSTHQRTHTGEKPYRCPSCPYSACRRDMITRHMRTHSRYELQDSSSMDDSTESRADPSRSMSGESDNLSRRSPSNLSREISSEVSFDMKQESTG